jgi:hypothetical protein
VIKEIPHGDREIRRLIRQTRVGSLHGVDHHCGLHRKEAFVEPGGDPEDLPKNEARGSGR